MTHQKVKHLCDFCNREYVVSKNAEEHEKNCYRNPDTRSCATCKFFFFGKEEVHYLAGGEDQIKLINGTGCEIDKNYIETMYGDEPSLITRCDFWEIAEAALGGKNE